MAMTEHATTVANPDTSHVTVLNRALIVKDLTSATDATSQVICQGTATRKVVTAVSQFVRPLNATTAIRWDTSRLSATTMLLRHTKLVKEETFFQRHNYNHVK